MARFVRFVKIKVRTGRVKVLIFSKGTILREKSQNFKNTFLDLLFVRIPVSKSVAEFFCKYRKRILIKTSLKFKMIDVFFNLG